MNASNESSVYSVQQLLAITSTSITAVLGIPINAWVLWLVFTGAAGTTMASEIFTLNLSVCEILLSLLCLLCFIMNIGVKFLYYFNSGLFFTGRPLFQSCMCVERFMAVVHPLLFLKCKPLRYRLACSVVAWLIIIGVSLLYTVLDRIFYIAVGECLVFMSVMLLCSLAILRALRQAGPGEAGRERDNTMKRRAFTIICLIMVSFLVTYFAWCVVIVISASQGLLETNIDTLALHICLSFTLISGLVQPLLYICQKTGKLPCFKPTQGT